jgi:hypothetical protein
VECPKCGRAVATGAFICPGCDYILDASFLGDDITDDERDHRPVKVAQKPGKSRAPREAQPDFGEDAMILGDVGAVDEVSSFKSRDAGISQREATQAKFYFGGVVAQLMQPDAIPEPAGGSGGASLRMTPFERHVLSFVNGKRSVGRIQKKSAMDESEFKTALAMLADKGFIKLKGFKKPREGSASKSQAPRRPLVAAPPAPPPAAERTVVASMDHIEALAKAGLRAMSEAPTRVGPVPGLRTSKPAPSSAGKTPAPAPVVPPAPTAASSSTVVATAPAVSRRFASLQAEPAVEHHVESHGEQPADNDEPIDPLRAAAAAAWDDVDNQSSVFSDGPSLPAVRSLPSLVDNEPVEAPPRRQHPLAATRPTGHFADDNGADDDDGLGALRDPTGMGDAVDDDNVGVGGGAPLDDNDDDNDVPPDGGFDNDDEEDDEVVAFSDPSLEAVDDDDIASWHEDLPPLSAPAGTVADDDIDDGLLGPPRRIHDDQTAALPVMAPVQHTVPLHEPQPNDDDDDDDFDISPKTNVLPRPMTLAPSALMPIEPPAPALPPSLPPVDVPKAPALMSLPGQNLRTAGAPPASFSVGAMPAGSSTVPPASRPLAATRVSAASQVPFELRKKAERIYEQALKDRAEGRLSSALMNAKLAMNFDSTVEAYKELFEALNVQKSQPQGPRPRELVLFEQASEAEGKGDHLRAVKLLEEAIAVNPRAGALYNRIGVVLSIRLKRHDEALMYLKKAIELEPGSVVYMNNFSKVTGLLESVLEKGPKKRKGNLDDDGGKVAVKKIRPRMF